tara:strand:- start:173 stop:481 length:309 start_codon:yes stop_codon:yes gene_type:complete
MSSPIATVLNSKLKKIFDSGWILTENNNNNIVYTSTTNAFEEFRITIENTKIKVAVPMPNSEVLYQTNLQTEEDVCKYIISHLEHIRNEEDILNNSYGSDSN